MMKWSERGSNLPSLLYLSVVRPFLAGSLLGLWESKMARQEQDALLTFFNSFKLAKRVTTFSQLADGKALLEVSATGSDKFRRLTVWS